MSKEEQKSEWYQDNRRNLSDMTEEEIEEFHKKLTEVVSKEKKMSKEEKLDKLLALEKKLTIMFDSDVRVAMALLEEVRKLNQNKDDE